MAGPTVSIEGPRGCGYRKEGGLYIMGGTLTAPCGRLPFELHACPTCGGGWRQARGWKWIEPRKLLAEAPGCTRESAFGGCARCPMGGGAPEKGGLMWVGAAYYTPESFAAEAAVQGISKRVPQVPRGVKAGVVCYLAHPDAITKPCPESSEADLFGEAAHEGCKRCKGERIIKVPGLFAAFVVTRIEKVVAKSITEQECEDLRDRGIEPVVVERAAQVELPVGTEAH